MKYVSQISKNFQEVDLSQMPHFKYYEANKLGKVIKEMLRSIKRQQNSLLEEKNKAEESEELMRDSEIKFRTLYESSNDAIFLIKENKIVSCNQRTMEFFKCNEDEIINKRPSDLSPEYQLDGELSIEKEKVILEEVFKGIPQYFEWQHKRPNGELFMAAVSLSFVELGREKYVQSSIRDITIRKKHELELEKYRQNLENMVEERTQELNKTNMELSEKNEMLKKTLHDLKETQSHLIQSEKMASLGILTAGVAHEINNPLNFVQNGTLVLQRTFDAELPESKEKYQPFFDAIKTGIDRIKDIVKSLSRYSRSQKTSASLCNVNEILDNCLTMLHNQYKNRIEIHKNYLDKTPLIAANEGELHQVFLNIISNAIQAISDNGKITIETCINDTYLQIKISDNGAGIKKENLKHIFDPFYTTKEPGEGTGLGLSITKKLVEEHNGSIKCKSVFEEGTTFEINLPVKHKSTRYE
ncbi:MAG: hypothetical protein C0599_14070 [Salinivirgaceae bacterium]|nr:MAG: hypothetical protein C0599_14070 [Salinivirgaceae bacterium]